MWIVIQVSKLFQGNIIVLFFQKKFLMQMKIHSYYCKSFLHPDKPTQNSYAAIYTICIPMYNVIWHHSHYIILNAL